MEQLSVRLQMVYDLIDKELASKGRVIDVGSDHGLLAQYCLLSDLTPFCVCTDIHKKPSERTRQCLVDSGLENRSEVFCTDGLMGVTLKSFDTVVMAGLGGNNIVDIIKAALKDNSLEVFKDVVLVLQPQKSADRLREFLFEEGFEIVDEIVSFDREYFYVGIKAKYTGIKKEILPIQKFFGPILSKREDGLTKEYFDHLQGVYKVRSRGDEELKALLEEMNV